MYAATLANLLLVDVIGWDATKMPYVQCSRQFIIFDRSRNW